MAGSERRPRRSGPHGGAGSAPADWRKIKGHLDVLLSAANDFFSACSRVVSVAFYTAPMAFDGVRMSLGPEFIELHNRFNKFDARRDWRLFNKWRPSPGAANGLPKKWLRLINVPHGFS